MELIVLMELMELSSRARSNGKRGPSLWTKDVREGRHLKINSISSIRTIYSITAAKITLN